MRLTEELSKGCVLVVLDYHATIKIQSWIKKNIPQDMLADDGVEHESHVTVTYGFLPDLDPDEVVGTLDGFGEVALKLCKVSRFDTSDEYDVLKVDVDSPDLARLHNYLKAVYGDRIEETFPEYHPHMTLAYVKKGACRELDGNSYFDGMVFVVDQAIYSSQGSAERRVAILAS
jgi:2'-5' RNA ligase